MKIQLHQFAHSPFCIPIAQALRSLSVPFVCVNIPYTDRSSLIRLTQGEYYQVPVLVHGRKIVYESGPESQDVAQYVDRHFAHGKLFPRSLGGLHTIVIQHLENEVEMATFKLVDPPYIRSISNLVDRTMVIRHKERKFGRGCVDAWWRHRTEIRRLADRVLHPYEERLRQSEFLFGNSQPVYADFLLFGILGNMTYQNYNRLSSRQRALQTWTERMEKFRF